jgi:hypothetical protein
MWSFTARSGQYEIPTVLIGGSSPQTKEALGQSRASSSSDALILIDETTFIVHHVETKESGDGFLDVAIYICLDSATRDPPRSDLSQDSIHSFRRAIVVLSQTRKEIAALRDITPWASTLTRDPVASSNRTSSTDPSSESGKKDFMVWKGFNHISNVLRYHLK